jgi:hypothetical protein
MTCRHVGVAGTYAIDGCRTHAATVAATKSARRKRVD